MVAYSCIYISLFKFCVGITSTQAPTTGASSKKKKKQKRIIPPTAEQQQQERSKEVARKAMITKEQQAKCKAKEARRTVEMHKEEVRNTKKAKFGTFTYHSITLSFSFVSLTHIPYTRYLQK